jgi:hypothetical protein
MTNYRKLLLICCEGKKTEPQYFSALQGIYHVPAKFMQISGGLGSHYELIDNCLKAKDEYLSSEGFDFVDDEIEVWAVCDFDKMNKKDITWATLEKEADSKGVKLEFSKPDFEAYLLQHFEQSSESKRPEIHKKLSEVAGTKYDKSDIGWLESILEDDPQIIDTAIVNCNQRRRSAQDVFFTVQNLVERIKEFEPR